MNLIEKFTQHIADKVSEAIAARMAELFAANVVTVAKMTYKPGDTIVIKVKRHMSKEAFAHLDASLREAFPGVKGIVLEEDLDIAAVIEYIGCPSCRDGLCPDDKGGYIPCTICGNTVQQHKA